MTQPLSDDARSLCVLCGQKPWATSPLDRSADSGPMLLAVHQDGTACGYVAHDLCVRYIRRHGPFSDEDCPCGLGLIVEGIAPPSSWGAENQSVRTDPPQAEDAADDGHEPPTLRESDEADTAADSDNEDGESDDGV